MAKGTAAKQEVMATILQVFPGSFLYNDNKEIRINTVENGEPVQIKVTLTAAKTPVEIGGDVAVPGAAVVKEESTESVSKSVEPSEEELKAISNLMTQLGL